MCNCIGIEIGSYGNQVELQRPAHMPNGSETICIDKCLKEEIIYLWSLGITTTGCCCGHNKISPYIGVDDKDIKTMKELGYDVHPNNLYPERHDSFTPKSTLL